MADRGIREAIVAEFHEQVVRSSLAKTRIKDIVEALNINRNSFYYHFENKYEVAAWAFRHDLAEELRRSVPNAYLVYAPVRKGGELLPFFVRDHQLLEGETPFMRAFVQCLLSDKDFYRKLLSFEEPELIVDLATLYERAVADDMTAKAMTRKYDRTSMKAIAATKAMSIVMTGLYFLRPTTDAECLLHEPDNPLWRIPYRPL